MTNQPTGISCRSIECDPSASATALGKASLFASSLRAVRFVSAEVATCPAQASNTFLAAIPQELATGSSWPNSANARPVAEKRQALIATESDRT